MSKNEKLEFDYEEYFDEQFKTTAILRFSTNYPSYTFAFYLNQLYSLDLERKDDVKLQIGAEEIPCPILSSENIVKKLTYIMIDCSDALLSGQLSSIIFDKTLLIIGENAHQTAQAIYDDLNGIGAGHADERRQAMLRSFIKRGILENALFDFSTPSMPRTTYFAQDAKTPELKKKRDKFLKAQREFSTDILWAVDSLLPDYETECYL